MSRSQRLLELMQILRRHRYPVNGAALSVELGISLRSLYRDIATLRAQGATIEGEAGVGYVLRPGFILPPLMFSQEELEALVLGSRWVIKRADTGLSQAAQNALAKIAHVLPQELQEEIGQSGLLVGPGEFRAAKDEDLNLIRQAIRRERKLVITYIDLKEKKSSRIIWPLALAFFDQVRVIVAWCELRQEFRHFRTDRIIAFELSEVRYPHRRQALLKTWREIKGVPLPQN